MGDGKHDIAIPTLKCMEIHLVFELADFFLNPEKVVRQDGNLSTCPSLQIITVAYKISHVCYNTSPFRSIVIIHRLLYYKTDYNYSVISIAYNTSPFWS